MLGDNFYLKITLYSVHLANICGDYCIEHGETCICGNQNNTKSDMLSQKVYCCNLSPRSCVIKGSNIICPNATIKNIKEKCHETCPYSECMILYIYI